MDCFDILDQLENTSSSNAKLELLKANRENKELAFLLKATFDYRKTYLIKEMPKANIASTTDWTAYLIEFPALLEYCSDCGRTQEAKQYVADWLSLRKPPQAKWYQRVILRDLRCGFGVDTAVKAGFDIPVFEVQLATDANKCKKLDLIVQKGVLISPKLDGYRCLAVGKGGEFTLYSRNGTVYQNFPSIKAELERLFPHGDYVFDGEIMSNDFNAMQQTAFASKRGTSVGDVQYFVFDQISATEWSKASFVEPYSVRYANLVATFLESAKDSTLLNLVVHDACYTVEQIREKQAQFEALGFEGAMANPDIPYYMGRKSNALLKFKSMMTQDCVITDFVEGKGRLEGTLGKVIVLQENGNTGEVGSGFSDEERDYIWKNKELVKGRAIEVKFQELTKDGYFRFPIFLRYRTDKDK